MCRPGSTARRALLATLGLSWAMAASSIAQPTLNGESLPLDVAEIPTGGSRASLAIGADGRFVVAWWEEANIRLRAGAGPTALRPTQILDRAPIRRPRHASIALQPGGTGLVAWENQDFSRGFSESTIFGRTLAPSGDLQGAAFRIDSTTGNFSSRPDAQALPGASFLVTWAHGASAAAGDQITGQRFELDGDPVGVNFRVDVSNGDEVSKPTAASTADGSFVVVWASTRNEAATEHDLLGRRFDSAATALGGEFAINFYTTGFQVDPHIQMQADGGFHVAWTSDHSPDDSDSTSIQLRRFTSDGFGIGSEMQVNTATTGIQMGPGLASGPNGTLLVVWEDWVSDPPTILARAVDATGTALGAAFVVAGDTSARFRGYATVAASGLGDFLVEWSRSPASPVVTTGHGDPPGPQEREILLQRVAASPPIFEDGFEQGVSSWDEVTP